MSIFTGFRQVRAIFSLVAVLLLFLGLFSFILISRQREFILGLERDHAVSELELIGTLAREALIRRDYATVEQFFTSWGMDNGDVVSIRADAPNGFTLALYKRDKATPYFFEASREVHSSDRKLISLRLVKDFTRAHLRMRRMLVQSISALALFALAMGTALWFTLRRTAILPMERLVEEVQELNQGLEERVEERTADLRSANEALTREMAERKKVEEHLQLSKRELEWQNDELKKLDVLKDALIRDVSHELKTPVAKHLMQLEILTGILGEKGVLESVEDVLQVMELGIRRQETAIRNILFMSRLEGGGRKTESSPFRLDTLVEEVVNDHMHAIATFGIRLQLELAPLTVVSDRELLWHVFANLVNNSIKYRSPKDPRLDIGIREANGGVVIGIADNGRGFSREEREKAFDRFYQSSPSTEGLGLGLNISRTIVETLGGQIRIESEGRDRGTAVTVTFPAPGEGGREAFVRAAVEKS